mgnify:CR=1 FL=1
MILITITKKILSYEAAHQFPLICFRSDGHPYDIELSGTNGSPGVYEFVIQYTSCELLLHVE